MTVCAIGTAPTLLLGSLPITAVASVGVGALALWKRSQTHKEWHGACPVCKKELSGEGDPNVSTMETVCPSCQTASQIIYFQDQWTLCPISSIQLWNIPCPYCSTEITVWSNSMVVCDSCERESKCHRVNGFWKLEPTEPELAQSL